MIAEQGDRRRCLTGLPAKRRASSSKKRFELVVQIQRKLEADVAKPILDWRFGYFVQWPHVKDLVPHHVIYNYARMQEVWLDR